MPFCLHYNIISNTFLIINLLNQQVSVPHPLYVYFFVYMKVAYLDGKRTLLLVKNFKINILIFNFNILIFKINLI